MIKYKVAKISDLNEIVKLWKTYDKEHYKIIVKSTPIFKEHYTKITNAKQNYKEFMSDNIKSKDCKIYLALDNKKVIGYVLCKIIINIPIFKIKKIGRIMDLYVKKEYRGQSISTGLFKLCKIWFKTKNIKHISLGVYPGNKHVHKIYEKWGFMDYHIEMRKTI